MSEEVLISSDDRRHVRVVISYTFLLLVASVSVGVIIGILRRLVGDGAEHQWGTWDLALALRLVATPVVCFAVYWRLARRHPHRFFGNGMTIAALTGTLNFFSSLAYAPGAQWMLLIVSVASHVVIFLLAATVFRLFLRMPVAGDVYGPQLQAEQIAAGDAGNPRA